MANSTPKRSPKLSAPAEASKADDPVSAPNPMQTPRYTTWQVVGIVAGVLALVTIACAAGVGVGLGMSRRLERTALTFPALRPFVGAPFTPRGHGATPWESMPYGRTMPYGEVMPFDGMHPPVAGNAYLGVTFEPGDNGAVVTQVISGSPAEGAGLRTGDVIHAVDGTVLTQAAQLRQLILAHQPGDQVSLTVLRGGSRQTIIVTLGSTPATSQ